LIPKNPVLKSTTPKVFLFLFAAIDDIILRKIKPMGFNPIGAVWSADPLCARIRKMMSRCFKIFEVLCLSEISRSCLH
jgi:hypothetical protein